MKPDKLPTNEAELAECLADPWWRLNNLHAIKPKQGGVKKYRPNKVQAAIYRLYWWLNYILKSRQHGVSTFWVLMFLDRILFEPGMVAGVIDITAKDAQKKLGMAKISFDHMDDPEVHPDTWQIGAIIKKRVKLIKGNDAPFPEELVFSNKSSRAVAVFPDLVRRAVCDSGDVIVSYAVYQLDYKVIYVYLDETLLPDITLCQRIQTNLIDLLARYGVSGVSVSFLPYNQREPETKLRRVKRNPLLTVHF